MWSSCLGTAERPAMGSFHCSLTLDRLPWGADPYEILQGRSPIHMNHRTVTYRCIHHSITPWQLWLTPLWVMVLDRWSRKGLNKNGQRWCPGKCQSVEVERSRKGAENKQLVRWEMQKVPPGRHWRPCLKGEGGSPCSRGCSAMWLCHSLDGAKLHFSSSLLSPWHFEHHNPEERAHTCSRWRCKWPGSFCFLSPECSRLKCSLLEPNITQWEVQATWQGHGQVLWSRSCQASSPWATPTAGWVSAPSWMHSPVLPSVDSSPRNHVTATTWEAQLEPSSWAQSTNRIMIHHNILLFKLGGGTFVMQWWIAGARTDPWI